MNVMPRNASGMSPAAIIALTFVIVSGSLPLPATCRHWIRIPVCCSIQRVNSFVDQSPTVRLCGTTTVNVIGSFTIVCCRRAFGPTYPGG